MSKNYRYEIKGTARGGQEWSTSGTLDNFAFDNTVFDEALRQSFFQLTEGKAVYGKPEQSCMGPYNITSVLIEQVKGN